MKLKTKSGFRPDEHKPVTQCPVPEIACLSLRSKWAVGKAASRTGGEWSIPHQFFPCDDLVCPAAVKLVRDATDEQRSRRPIFIATLRAAASWLFFRPAAAGLAPYVSI